MGKIRKLKIRKDSLITVNLYNSCKSRWLGEAPLNCLHNQISLTKAYSFPSETVYKSNITHLYLWLKLNAPNFQDFYNYVILILISNTNKIRIGLFKGIINSVNNSDELDIYFNAVGPITAIAFSRARTKKFSSDKFLAVGVSQIGWPYNNESNKATVDGSFGIGSNYLRYVGVKEFHNNLLQIWSLRKIDDNFSTVEHNKQISINLAYTVELNKRGSVCELSWSDINFSDSAVAKILPLNNNGVDSIGLLSVVCGDGTCLVFLLPRYHQHSSPHCEDYSLENDLLDAEIGKTTVFSEVEFCKWEINSHDDVMIKCHSWNNNQHVEDLEICCGMVDGSITIWKLNWNDLYCDGTKVLMYPFMRLLEFDNEPNNLIVSCVNAVQYCPYEPNLILTCNNRGLIKIWDKNNIYLPVLTKESLFLSINDLQWDLNGVGFYMAGSDQSTITMDPLRSRSSFAKFRTSLHTHMYQYGGVWKLCTFLIDGQSVVLSVASDGTVRGGFTSCLSLMKAVASVTTVELFHIKSILKKEVFIENNDEKIDNSINNNGYNNNSNNNNSDYNDNTAKNLNKLIENIVSVSKEKNGKNLENKKKKVDDEIVMKVGLNDVNKSFNVALQAIDYTPFFVDSDGEGEDENSEEGDEDESIEEKIQNIKNKVIVAYGGITGFVRIQSVNILELMFS